MVGLLTNFLRFVSQSEIMPVFKSVRLRKVLDDMTSGGHCSVRKKINSIN
jgi:hypothetical protein